MAYSRFHNSDFNIFWNSTLSSHSPSKKNTQFVTVQTSDRFDCQEFSFSYGQIKKEGDFNVVVNTLKDKLSLSQEDESIIQNSLSSFVQDIQEAKMR